MPDPDTAGDLAEFIEALGRLRLWAGAPSYRTLVKRIGLLRHGSQAVAQTTVVDTFNPRRRRLDFDLVIAIVRALGLDEAAVDRWREACIRVHGAAMTGGPTGVFRQLPADLATFTGRETVLKQLLDTAMAPASENPAATVVVSVIEGMGGVGKTQLAVHAAHHLVRSGHFTDVQLYVNLRGFDPERPPADPTAVLDAFLRQLGVPGRQIPEPLDERAAMYRDRIHGRNALVLLDNAADEHQIRPLIPAGAHCLVLITSRRTMAGLEGAEILQLDVLDETEAVDLLAAVAGEERINTDPVAAAKVAEACGNLPLALTIAAARLKARTSWAACDLLEHLIQGGLDAMTVGRRSLRPVFDLSFDALPPGARLLYLLLGIQPGTDVTPEAAAALAGITPRAARKALEGLCDEYLLLQRSPGRFELHDILRAYAVETAAVQLSTAEWAPAVDRLLDWYTQTAEKAATTLLPSLGMPTPARSASQAPAKEFTDRAAAVAWLEVEHANLLAASAAATAAGNPEAAWRIPAAASVLRAVNQNWPECETLLTDALSGVRRTGDLAEQAWIQNRLGATATELGRTKEAEEMFTAALTARRLLEDRDGEAAVLNNLVIFYGRTDRPQLGLEPAALALELARREGNTDREASALNAMAACLSGLGRNAEALELMLQVVAIRESRGDGYRLGLAYNVTSSRHRDLGQFEAAETYNVKAREIAHRSGDRFGEGEALQGQALALLGQGRPAVARSCLQEAAVIFKELDADRYLAEARRLLAEIEV